LELTGPDGINMGVVFRKKFVQCVLNLKGIQPNVNGNNNSTNNSNNSNNSNSNGNTNINGDSDNTDNKSEATDKIQIPHNGYHSKNSSNTSIASLTSLPTLERTNSNTMSKKEEKILTSLVETIKLHTTKLRKTKEELAKIEKQKEDCLNEVAVTFEKAMATLVARRKNLETMMQMANEECTSKLTTQIEELQSSAKKLLLCQKGSQDKLNNLSQSKERETTVINSVNQALNNLPKSDLGTIDIIYTPDKIELNEFIEKYGKVAVGKKKI